MKTICRQAIDAYIQSAALSEDFTAGYAQALAIATGLGKQQPEQGASDFAAVSRSAAGIAGGARTFAAA